MEKEIIRTIELELISEKENYYCMTCDRVVESKTFMLIEKRTKAVVSYPVRGFPGVGHFECSACRERNK